MKSCVVGFVILLIIRTAVAADLPPTFDVNRAEDLARITSECREFILSNSQLVKLTDINAVTIDEVCSCQAPWFISSLDDNTPLSPRIRRLKAALAKLDPAPTAAA